MDLSTAGLDKTNVIKCSARVYDGYDNSSWTNSSNTATIQNTAPVISNPQTTVNWNANGTTYNYDYGYTDDDGDSVTWYDNTTLFDINSGTGIILDTPVEAEVGTYAVRISVSDGTTNTTDDFSYTIIDVTFPTLSITYPGNTSYTVNVSQLNFTYIETNPDKCWYSKNSGATNLSIQTCTLNFTDVISIEGSNTWIVYINDTSGNENSTSVTFSKDTAYPIVTINSPSNQTYNTDSITFNVTATDGGSVSSCWYSLNSGTTNSSLTNTAGDYYTATNASMVQGSHTANYYCNDSLNNLNNTEQVTFFIDSIFPSITSLTEFPSDPATYSVQTYEFNATITDTNLDVFLIEFDNVNYTPSQNGNVYNLTLSDLAAGTYNYSWYANDTANNVNQTSVQTYTINNATGDVTLLINDSASNQIAPYTTQTNASATTLYGSVILYRNGTVVTSENNIFVTLAVGYYNYTAISNGDQNHSSASTTLFVDISKISSEVNLTLNVTSGNVTIVQDNSIYLNTTTIAGDSGAT